MRHTSAHTTLGGNRVSGILKVRLKKGNTVAETLTEQELKSIEVSEVNGDGWKEIPIENPKGRDELLVPVGPFSKFRYISTSSAYAGEHSNTSPYKGGLEGSTLAIFVREKVAERLMDAQSLLPRGLHLVVMDAYRTLEVQKALYDVYYDALADLKPTWTPEQLAEESQKYVSIPSSDPQRPSPHNTGGSVDVMLVRVTPEEQDRIDEIHKRLDELDPDAEFVMWGTELYPDKPCTPTVEEIYALEMEKLMIIHGGSNSNGLSFPGATPLEFGVPFDHGTEKASARYFERPDLTAEEKEYRDNRRMLWAVMSKAGFGLIPSEFWHFNAPESQWGAIVNGLPSASYGPIELSKENLLFDKVRRDHHTGIKKILDGTHPGVPMTKILPGDQAAFLRLAASNAHALGQTTMGPTEAIKPAA